MRTRGCATLPGRAATGGHGRRPPHARATGRRGAGRQPPSEHADVTNAGRRVRRCCRVDSGHRDPWPCGLATPVHATHVTVAEASC
jgi:hypothetical protein